jgi:hypothetical protein
MSPRVLATALACSLAFGMSTAAAAAPDTLGRYGVHLLGERIVPLNLPYAGTIVGGLSGIDYDPRTGQYLLISDDRSAIDPARFYTATFPVTAQGVGEVTFTGTHPFLRPDGTTYPPLSRNDPSLPQNEQTVDPEEVRVDPWTGDVFWSQEGERTAAGPTASPILIDPSIRAARPDGTYVRDLPIPPDERMVPGSGPRQNLALEGLTFAGSGTLVASSVEAPLLQDGPLPDPAHGVLSRITLQSRSWPVLAQYAYPQDPVFATPDPPTAAAGNGVSSLLAFDKADSTRFLVMERAFVTGVGNKVRIYEIDTTGATNVLHVPSLADAKDVRPVRKRLLVDLADLPLSTVDNLEGMTWGPDLPSGERTLVLVSDNNFAAAQVTQLVALGVRWAAPGKAL